MLKNKNKNPENSLKTTKTKSDNNYPQMLKNGKNICKNLWVLIYVS